MTQEEARKKSQEKVNQLKELARVLKIRILAKNAIIDGSFVEPTVYFTDEEQYDIKKPETIVRKPKKDDKNTTT
jgi:hypothetical protein